MPAIPPAPLTSHSAPRIGTLTRVLSAHPFFSNWPLEMLRRLEGHCTIRDVRACDQLLKRGALDVSIHILLAGELELRDADGGVRTVAAVSPDARFPVARLRPSVYEVHAVADSRVLCVEQSVLRSIQALQLASRRGPARFQLEAPVRAGSWREHPLVSQLVQAQREQRLTLPVIPAIALKLRDLLAREDFAIADVSRVIAADPGISAKLLQISNSALFAGTSPCTNLSAAVMRLGVKRVQNLVLAVSTAQLFKAREPVLRERLSGIWRHLVDTGALAAALAGLTAHLDPDLALLTGMLHEVGKLTVLERAVRHPDLLEHSGLLDDILEGLGPTLSAATLKQWSLADDLICASERQTDWHYDHDGACDYTDVLLVAHIHALAKSGQHKYLPRLDETPALSRITGAQLTPRESLAIIEQARANTQALKALLN